ncbi:hypothetical protein B0E55_03721 [Rhodococcus sp. 66b]|nr:hypothetical protein B0E55_03721 [Rhodococcus sp. 66b]
MKVMTNPLVVQFTGIAGGRLVGALIQALSMVLLARISGPSGFGIFAAAYGVGLVLQTILNFGFTPFLVRIRALGDQDPLIASTLEFSRRANLAVGALLAFTAAVAAVFEPKLWFVVPLTAWVVLDNYVETLLSLPLADGNTWQNAVSLLLRRALALVFVAAAWLAGVDAVFWYSVGLAFSSMIAVFVAIRLGPAITRVRSRRSYKSIIGRSSHFWLNSVATQTRNFDVLLVGLVTSPAVSGIYGVTSRITTPLRLIPTSFAAVLMPAAARSTTGRITQGILRPAMYVCIASAVIFGVIAAAIPVLVPPILGDAYVDAVPVMQVVCFSLIFAAISSQLNAILQGTGRVEIVSYITVVSTLICLVGIVLAAPRYGALGAGWSLSLSYVLQTALLTCVVVVAMRRDPHA